MAEQFGRASLGPGQYDPNTWTPLYEVKSTIVGALVFDISVTNTTPMSGFESKDITIEMKVVDSDGNLIHWILGPQALEQNGISWDSSQKIVLNPGDRLMVRASDRGVCFYSSLITGLKVIGN